MKIVLTGILLAVFYCCNASSIVTIQVTNGTGRPVMISKYDSLGNYRLVYSQAGHAGDPLVIEDSSKQSYILTISNYFFCVSDGDSIVIHLSKTKHSAEDSLVLSGNRVSFYNYWFLLARMRKPFPPFDYSSKGEQIWQANKAMLENAMKKELTFLECYRSQWKLPYEFYKKALDEIKYRYFVNCLSSGFSLGIDMNDSIIIPQFVYSDIRDADFEYRSYSNSFQNALVFYAKHLTDSAVGVKSGRYNDSYLNMLVDIARTRFKGLSKQILIRNIVSEYSVVRLQKYQKAFAQTMGLIRSEYSDISFLETLDSLYSRYDIFNKKFPGPVLDTKLIEMSGRSLTFKDILAKFSGKIIYFDFWASWCGPCLEEMPVTLKMQEQLKDSNIVFVFISVDTKASIAKWREAAKSHAIEANQFLLWEDFSSELCKFLQVGSIPTHFLVDKSGLLISNTPPRTNSASFITEISKYLFFHVQKD